ncbi:MAG: acetolactate decarboxylase [Deltaproteobacteria bacterium]|nr:acetolactate decarboxylase [Deltaproteobacteria bacterium]
MKIRRSGLIAVLLVAWLTCAAVAAEQKVLFQTSTLQALMNGVCDSDFTCAELSQHGDFGLGTFEALDGEMVVLDGKFYQVKTDGRAYPVNPAQKTPFGEVTFFKADQTLTLSEPLDLKQLEGYLAKQLPSSSFPYAVKITGKFSYIKTRSVPRQSKPYPPLTEVAKQQKVFEFRDTDGVIVGFFHPQYLAGVNVGGYHCHFLTADRQAGGHLLDCRIQQVKVELSQMHNIDLRLPGTAAFSRTDLSGDKQQEIEKVEK